MLFYFEKKKSINDMKIYIKYQRDILPINVDDDEPPRRAIQTSIDAPPRAFLNVGASVHDTPLIFGMKSINKLFYAS